MKIIGIIPARFQSSRFPGKPLIDIAGKSMVHRVYEQVKRAQGLADVVVATDDHRIADHLRQFNLNVCMTSISHPSGTDRCAEVASMNQYAADAYVNIQGDEPFIAPEQIEQVIQLLHTNAAIATLVKKITDPAMLNNHNVVKVVSDQNGAALYFSRSPIPYQRGYAMSEWLKHATYYHHIGIYGYQSLVLKQLASLPKTEIEVCEQLEQLRWLSNNFQVATSITNFDSIAIDTPQDLENALKKWNEKH